MVSELFHNLFMAGIQKSYKVTINLFNLCHESKAVKVEMTARIDSIKIIK